MGETLTDRQRLDLQEAAMNGDDALDAVGDMIFLAKRSSPGRVQRLESILAALQAVRDEMRREAEGRP